MRLIDADELLKLVDPDEYYHSNEVRDMIDIVPTVAFPPNDPLTLGELREMDKNHVIAYLPGEKVYDRFGTPWVIESSEIHLIRGELKQLFRCWHPGTEDYHAMYEDEIYTSPYRRKLEEVTP